MTDNEIIKALECFAIDKDFDETHCIGCAFEHQFCTANMSEDIAIPALDLINRQKAEIERYKKNDEFISKKCDSIQEKLIILNSEIVKALATAKADAYLEFVVRALKRIGFIEHTNATVRGYINKVYEELMEESK